MVNLPAMVNLPTDPSAGFSSQKVAEFSLFARVFSLGTSEGDGKSEFPGIHGLKCSERAGVQRRAPRFLSNDRSATHVMYHQGY